MPVIDFILKKLRIFWHLLFWAGAFIILLQIFRNEPGFERIDVLYTTFFMLPILIAVYINLYLLIPKFLRKQRILYYSIAFITLSLLSATLIFLLFENWIDYLIKNYYFISDHEIPDLVIYTTVFLLSTTMLKLSKEWFFISRKEEEKTRMQLRNLQAQINPHFLLNSLQTIYSLSLNKSEKAADSILRLSDILKYTLYVSEDELVYLSKELEVVKDYIEMHRLRLDAERAKLSINITGETDEIKIIPMIFLPFIENSFKHGLQGSEKEAFVHIDFQINKKTLNFTIENNIGDTDHIEGFEQGGIGIKNTRKRLELFYKNKYALEVDQTDQTYRVSLSIDISKMNTA